jgi:hypothetical protein
MPVKNRRRRPAKEVLVVRLPPEILAALNRRVTQQQRERPGADVTRSEVVRELLYQVLGPEVQDPQEGVQVG